MMTIELGKNNDRPLNDVEKTQVRKMSGQMAWIVGQTRPDMAFESCQLSNYGKCPTVQHLKDTSLKCGSSQGAYIIFLVGKEKVTPICWQSKKLQRVTKSPIVSETLALDEGADASYLLASIIQETYMLQKLPKIICFTDNKSLFNTLKTSNVTKDMRLRVDIARLR